MIENKPAVPGLTISSNPGVLDLISVTASNYWKRFEATYYVKLQPTIDILSGNDGGALALVIPLNFDLDAVKKVTCNGNGTFGDEISCVLNSRILNIPSPAEGFTAGQNVYIDISITGLVNPQLEGETADFQMFVMDTTTGTTI
jgi:hypothetical protein